MRRNGELGRKKRRREVGEEARRKGGRMTEEKREEVKGNKVIWGTGRVDDGE